MFLGLWAVRILLSLLTAMVFFITTFNGVLAQDQPPITSNFSGQVYFQPVSSAPRPLSLLMCLTIFTWMPWNARLLVCLSFFQKLRRFTNNAAPASVPVGLHHHDSGHLTDGDHFRTATESFYMCPGSGGTSRL